MTTEEAAQQIFDEFKAHWDTLNPAIPIGYEGQTWDPSDPAMVPDKRTGWAFLTFEPFASGDGIVALGNRLLRQNARVRCLCAIQANTGVLKALTMADHALLYFQRGSSGIRFNELAVEKRGNRSGWWECFAQATVSFDHVV